MSLLPSPRQPERAIADDESSAAENIRTSLARLSIAAFSLLLRHHSGLEMMEVASGVAWEGVTDLADASGLQRPRMYL